MMIPKKPFKALVALTLKAVNDRFFSLKNMIDDVGNGGSAGTLQVVTDNGNETTNSIEYVRTFASIAGNEGSVIENIKTEKYGLDYGAEGKMGEWNRYISRNWYNPTRPGEILTRDSYNTNESGGTLLAGEGSWSHVLESDYLGKFEDYVQVTPAALASYRPFAMYIGKGSYVNDTTFSSNIFHVTYPGTANDFANFKNGKTVLTFVGGSPSEVVNPTLILEFPGAGKPEFALQNNGSSGLFSGMSFYAFDNHLYAFLDNTTDIGIGGSSWRDIYLKRRIMLGNSAGTAGQVIKSGGAAAANAWGHVSNVGAVPSYADNAAAITGGLVAGDLYRTADVLKVVH